MRLRNSIPVLQHEFNVMQDRKGFDSLWADKVTAVKKLIKDPVRLRRRLTWDLWWALDVVARNNVIAASIPTSEWIGGYPDITDEQLNTLLNKVFSSTVTLAMEQSTLREHVDNDMPDATYEQRQAVTDMLDMLGVK